LGIGWFGVAGVKVGAMAEGGICMGTNERTEVNTIADCGDGADGRGGMWGKETTMLCAFFFSDLGADGLKAIVK
jgi:hypothetical protein